MSVEMCSLFWWKENSVWNNVSIKNGKESFDIMTIRGTNLVNNVKKERKIRIKCQLLLPL